MKTFRCKYRDTNEPWKIREERVQAPDQKQAFEQFVRSRRNDNWSLSDIFVHSHVELIEEGTDEVYIIDPYGEVKKPNTTFPL